MNFSFKKWLESHVDFEQYDLQKRYDHFNALLFNNELPNIPIEYANIKGAGGQRRPPSSDSMRQIHMIRLGLVDKYYGAEIVPGSHRMQISKLFKRSEQALDAIMIHEMIHVYFNHIGKFGERHGNGFVKMAKAFGAKVGFTIPLTDGIENLGLTDETKIRTIGVQLLYHKDNTNSIALMSEKTMINKLPALALRWRSMINQNTHGNYGVKTEFYTISSLIWTELSHRYPMQRVLTPQRVGYYKMPREGRYETALEDLKKNGKLLLSIP